MGKSVYRDGRGFRSQPGPAGGTASRVGPASINLRGGEYVFEKRVVIVETALQFQAALDELVSQRCVSLDTETVGIEAKELWALATHFQMEQSKSEWLAGEYVEALCEKGLTKEQKAHAREMRDHWRNVAREWATKHRTTKAKADKNPGGLEHYRNELACVQIGTDHAVNGGVGTAYLIRPSAINPSCLRDFLNSRDEVLMHNAKFDYKQLKHPLGVELSGHNLVDTQAREYVLTMGTKAKIGLNACLEKYCGVSKNKKVALHNWAGEWTEEMVTYAAGDVLFLFDVARQQDKELLDTQMPSVYLEQDLALTLGDMELEGIGVDRGLASIAAEHALGELRSYENDLRVLCPGLENPNSPVQLLEWLQAQGHKISSSDKKAIKSLGDVPYAAAILKMREFGKVLGTYYEPLRDECVLINRGTDDEHYRIFANFNAVGRGDDDAGTDTGRLSSSNPNLQNQPAKKLIPLPAGSVPLRAIFIPRPGWKFVHIDLPQIEPRILGHITQDATLLKAFHEKKDVYLMMGSMMTGRTYEDVYVEYELYIRTEGAQGSKKLREDMKVALLSVMYLKTAFGLARDYMMTQIEAYRFLNSFFRKFLPVKRFIKATLRELREQGFLDNLCGRRRQFPGYAEANKGLQAHYDRAGVNFKIQGPAAHMMKLSLVLIRNRIKAEGLQDVIKLLLTVHDEVVVEAKDDPQVLAKAVEIVKWGMEEPLRMFIPTVPTELEPKVIDTWAEGKD